IASRFMIVPSGCELRHVKPASLARAPISRLGELYALGAFEQIPAEFAFPRNMLQEQLPLRFEGIVPGHIVRYLLPALGKIDGLRDVWIPYRLGRVDARLRQAAPQPCDRRPVRAVDLQSQQIIAPNAH